MMMHRMRTRRRLGFSLMELLIVVAILMIIAAIAAPKVGAALMNAREMAAVRHITTIHSAQLQYMSQFGKYASSLIELGPPASGAAGPAASDLIPKELAEGVKGGYKFTLSVTPTGYTINADPTAFGNSGRRTFFSDQTQVIRENWGQEPANASSKELNSQEKAKT
jgi:prepilin-type N-terminal cleavage/methylation domain-containing protein